MPGLLLQVFSTVRSERLLTEELAYKLLLRWFIGLNMDDATWHPTTFTKNRSALVGGDVAAPFLTFWPLESGRKLFRLAKATKWVPFTVTWSSDSRPAARDLRPERVDPSPLAISSLQPGTNAAFSIPGYRHRAG